MSEIRKDPLSDRRVIIAQGRDDRPDEFDHVPPRRIATRCPFCAGNEQDTPQALACYGAADLPNHGVGRAGQSTEDRRAARANREEPCPPDWLVRVVPNKYPALQPTGTTDARHVGPFEVCAALGQHEVIIESPRHVSSYSQLTDTESRLLVLAYRDRMRHLRANPALKYALIFKNVGPEGGASLEHSHSQIVATPNVPVEIRRELSGAQRQFRAHDRCFFCRMLEFEHAQTVRWIDQSPRFAAVCPFASRMPFELWILPREHASHFDDQPESDLVELAQFMRKLLKKLEAACPHVAYNYFIHTAPFDTNALRHYHWHIEVLPRLTTTAGFEWGAGYFINPVPPEEATRILRLQ